jgi:hypothetical protein
MKDDARNHEREDVLSMFVCGRMKNRKWFPPISNTTAPFLLAHDTLITNKFLAASFRFENLRERNTFTLHGEPCSDLNVDTTFIGYHYYRMLKID